ncbi:MAG: histone deacetylase family protein [Burkholderiaceae bacterium]|jgi:acetoin utilization deacetylase AcuC-like enzyme
MTCAYITHPDCMRHEMGASHPEAPVRLAAIHDRLLLKGLLDLMSVHDAPLASQEQLARAHSHKHVADTLAASPIEGYVHVDPDTFMNPHTALAALRAAGAVILGIDLVLGGDASSAFCCVRPPGHHAERDAAMGFCFFNNAAVGIRHATHQHGLERVALIDFDVHHGNGSEDILRGDRRVLMCSSFEDDLYPFPVDVAGDNMVNIGLPARSGGAAFREAVTSHWLPALDRFAPQLIVVSAGFDGHREDDMGNLGLVDDDYLWVTRQIRDVAQRHCNGRIVSTLEGGYNPAVLARCVEAHASVLIGAD